MTIFQERADGPARKAGATKATLQEHSKLDLIRYVSGEFAKATRSLPAGKSRRAPQTCLRQAGCALRYRFCDTAEVGVDAENERSTDSDHSKTMIALTTLLFCGSGLRGWREDAA